MTAHKIFFVTFVLSQVLRAQAGTPSVDSGVLTSADYVAGTTPTGLALTATFVAGVAFGPFVDVTIAFTSANQLFVASSNPTVSVSGGSSPTFSGWAVNGAGTVLTGTLSGGSITGGQAVFTISDNLAALPSAGAQTVSVVATSSNTGGDTGGTAATIFYTLVDPTITLTRANMNAGTAPTQLQVVVKTAFALSSGQTIVITANKAVFAASVTTGLTITGAAFGSYTTNGGGTTFTGTLNANANADVSIDMTLATALLTNLPSSAGAVTLSIAMNSITVVNAASGFGVINVIAAFGNDPVARFGAVRREFELPPGVMTTLVEAPDFVMRGTVFEGGGSWEQWFNRIVLTVPWQDRFIEIKIRENLQDFNFSKVPQSAFQTLDITMGYSRYGSGRAVTQISDFHEIVPWEFLGHQITFRKVKRNYKAFSTTIGRFPRECIDAAGKHMHFYICSAAPQEYYGQQRDLSLKYAHLDMAFVEVKNYKALTGLLPELWGVQPMSESTKAFVKEEKPHAPKVTIESSSAEKTAWAGGPGMENITKSCFEPNEATPDTKLVV